MSERLALYHFVGCPWCERVWAALDDLGIEVESRDVRQSLDHAAALEAAMGRGTVPVLQIDDGSSLRWLPESSDIVAYLYERYGEGRAPALFAGNTLQTTALALAVGLLAAGMLLPETRGPLWLGAALVFALRNNVTLLRRLVAPR